ncbi:MAG TPA: hypothetical protein VMM92_16495, partial [Thermoanaerobaculia bacterium]|nr:hypothetical protein [Thermoanaerobaculia bacterium]
MNHLARRFSLLVLLGGCLAFARPAAAHQGPPFPILVDQRVGPYVAQVWTDPDIGIGTFYVVLEPPKGAAMPAWTKVKIAVAPVSGRLREVAYDMTPESVHTGARFLGKVQFDRGEMWNVRVSVDSAAGGGELRSKVEATPDGTIGPIGLLV